MYFNVSVSYKVSVHIVLTYNLVAITWQDDEPEFHSDCSSQFEELCVS